MLPQRRKSAEEIAKLREEMGIPGAAAPEPDSLAEEAPAHSIFEAPEPGELPPPPPPKPVRSLRRSERVPVEAHAPHPPPADGHGVPLPQRRHNDRELQQMRMQTVATPEKSLEHIHHLEAPRLWRYGGYFASILGFLAGYYGKKLPLTPTPQITFEWLASLSRTPSFPLAGLIVMGVLSAVAFALAGLIWWKKPRSRHHAGFIATLTILLLTIAIIYHLPTEHGP